MKRGFSRLKHNNLCPDLILPPFFVLHVSRKLYSRAGSFVLEPWLIYWCYIIRLLGEILWCTGQLTSTSFFHSLFIYMPLFHAINLLCFVLSLHLIIFPLILQPLVADDWQMVCLPEPSSARGVSLLKETFFVAVVFFKERPSGRP